MLHVYEAHVNPALNGSLPVRHFKCGDVIEIRNEIIFDFGLHRTVTCVCTIETHQNTSLTSSADFGLSLAQRELVYTMRHGCENFDGTHEASVLLVFVQ